MRKLLVIDESPLYRDFIQEKFNTFGMEVVSSPSGLDGMMKLRQASYDLIIMDYFLSRSDCFEILDRKKDDPNLRNTPVIIVSSKLDRNNLIKLGSYGVRKVFTKPLKIDALVEAVSGLLNMRLELDNTPCILEANINEDIYFIELAQGLNPDKIYLLKYRLRELSEVYHPDKPKVLLIMSALDLGADDSLGLATLLGTIQEQTRVRSSNFKILTSNEFVRNFVASRPAWDEIQVHSQMDAALGALKSKASGTEALRLDDKEIHKLLGGIQSEWNTSNKSGLGLRFANDLKDGAGPYYDLAQLQDRRRLAVVDDDLVIREVMKKTFEGSKVELDLYHDGQDFLESAKAPEYDLVFLDLMMPRKDGFQVLEQLRSGKVEVPVVVLSALNKQDTVLKAMKLGIKSYLVKPVHPEEIRKKAVDIFRMNF